MKILYGFLALIGLGTLVVVGVISYTTIAQYLGFEAYMWEHAATSATVVMPRPQRQATTTVATSTTATTTATTTEKSEPTVYAPLIQVP